MFCKKCGKELADGTKFCPYCGENLQDGDGSYTKTEFYSANGTKVSTNGSSDKSRGLALIFALLGCFCVSGIHRFYVGKIGTGILWLLTGGLFGIGTIIDIIMIATGSFNDIDGKPLTDWNID